MFLLLSLILLPATITKKIKELSSDSSCFDYKDNKKSNSYELDFLARRKGFEPPTFWFVAKHSIQLS